MVRYLSGSLLRATKSLSQFIKANTEMQNQHISMDCSSSKAEAKRWSGEFLMNKTWTYSAVTKGIGYLTSGREKQAALRIVQLKTPANNKGNQWTFIPWQRWKMAKNEMSQSGEIMYTCDWEKAGVKLKGSSIQNHNQLK